MAVPAQARPIESASSELGPVTQVEPPAISSYELSHGLLGDAVESQPPVISYLSHGMTAADVEPPVINYLSQGMTAADALDPRTGIPLSAGIPVQGDPFIADAPAYTVELGRSWYLATDTTPVRPDDRADRFVVGDGTPAAPVTDGDGFTVDWESGLPIGVGALALVLALGLAVTYLRRPRIVV
jgi:hypothetical protein